MVVSGGWGSAAPAADDSIGRGSVCVSGGKWRAGSDRQRVQDRHPQSVFFLFFSLSPVDLPAENSNITKVPDEALPVDLSCHFPVWL